MRNFAFLHHSYFRCYIDLILFLVFVMNFQIINFQISVMSGDVVRPNSISHLMPNMKNVNLTFIVLDIGKLFNLDLRLESFLQYRSFDLIQFPFFLLAKLISFHLSRTVSFSV